MIVGRIKLNQLLLSGELNERLPAVQNGLVMHYPFDGTTNRYVPNEIRYIRDYLGYGSTANGANHWIELQAFDENDVNVALNKTAVTSSGTAIPQWVDGNSDTAQWNSPNAAMSEGTYHTVDLGKTYNIKTIKHWHYWGDGRRYYKTRVAVSQDGINWFDVFDSGIEGEYNESASGHTIDLASNATITPSVNTNTTLKNEYIAVEEATTNLGTSGLSGMNGISYTYVGEEDGYKKYAISGTWNSGTYPYSFNLGMTQYTGGLSYSLSCYLYTNVPQKFADTGGYGSFGTINIVNDSNMTGAMRAVKRGNYTAREDFIHSANWNNPAYVISQPIANGTVFDPNTDFLYVKDIQVEQKPFATSFVNGSRAAGKVDIPFNLKPPYSINLWHTGIKPLSLVADQGSSPMIFQMGNYYSNASISFWNFVKKLTVYVKGDASSAWTTSKEYYSYTDTSWKDTEHMYTLVATDNRTFKVYMDGVYLGQQVSTEDVTNISFLRFNDTTYAGHANARYRGLSVFNKVLSDNEVKTLYNNNFSITPDGNLLVSEFIETPNKLPSDAYYASLASDAKDRLGLIRPSSESNTVYEFSNVWVGNATTNEYVYPNFNTSAVDGGWAHWNAAGSIGSYGQNTDPDFIYSLGNKYSHWVANDITATGNYLVYQSPEFPGGYRSVQAIICMSDGSPVTNNKVFPVWNAANGGIASGTWTSIKQIANSKWYLCKAEGLSQDGTNDLIGFYVTPGYKAYIDTAQVEQKRFCSPITLSARGNTDLEFNFNRDIGLDWSKDWSIVYWKKPIGTHANNLVGYNIESLGSNSNTVGTGYLWFGKENGQNTVRLNTNPVSSVFSPSDYFNNWHMVSIVKSGTTITYTHCSEKLGKYVASTTNTTTAANYFVTQYGYDFKFGWDNVNPSNSFYRDLIVIKRALTNNELGELYGTPLSINKGKVQISNQIIEEYSF